MAKQSYSEEDKRIALTVAIKVGNCREASDLLAHGDATNSLGKAVTVPARTLQDWLTRYPDLAYDVRESLKHEMSIRAAQQADAIILKSGRIEDKLLDRLDDGIEELPMKDVAAALRNVSTTKALNNDKIVGPNRGRPTVVVQTQSADDLNKMLAETIRELRDLGIDVDSIADADVVAPVELASGN